MRVPMSQKIRFEVFKRDSFTCQYCGAKAPDVVLHVDHIEPVAEGGTNNVLNLVTACNDCNSGKGVVRLSDDSAIEKSRKQAELLQERREQIEMIAAWYREVSTQEDLISATASEFIPSGTIGLTPNEHGIALLKKWAKKYGLAGVIESTRIAFEQYFHDTEETWEKAFTMIPRIAHIQNIRKKDPSLAEAYRLRGILRSRLRYIDYGQSLDILAALVDEGDLVGAERLCHAAKSWTDFCNTAVIRIESLRNTRGAQTSAEPN
jgi:hypothetical protein